jgi:multicomponent Na+:H+ antiporter subunit E
MGSSVDTARNVRRSALGRAAFFFGYWLILSGVKPADILMGAVAAVAATWTSLRLLPPGQLNLGPVALAKLVLRFPRQSIIAGIDAAWRALDPRMPLQSGLVVYQSRLPLGPIQNAFCTMTSLLPGTLPCGFDERGGLIMHCLDVNQPVLEQLATEEALLAQALGGSRNND